MIVHGKSAKEPHIISLILPTSIMADLVLGPYEVYYMKKDVISGSFLIIDETNKRFWRY